MIYFRWKTAWTGATTARCEVSRLGFPKGPEYKLPQKLDHLQTVYSLPENGKHALFRIDFEPIVQKALGTRGPNCVWG